MSLTQDHGNHVFQCDGTSCGDTLDTGTSNFDSALNVLRRARWTARRKDQFHDWQHFCVGCQHKGKAPDRQRELV